MTHRELCVFTPTYNRKSTLPNLYRSLEEQNCSDAFSWLIVDDGSNDGTEEYIQQLQSIASFPISYIKVENGGKQRAINVGVRNCKEELFFSIDSDDMVAPNAINLILNTWKGIKENKKCAGIVGLDQDPSGNIIGTKMPANLEWVTSIDLYEKHKFKGDTTRIYRTDVLERFPFEVALGEKFVSESSVFHRIDQEYILKVINEPLMIVEYRNDGYSSNVRKVIRENPIGYYRHKRQCAIYHSKLINKYMDTILYLIGCDLAKKENPISDFPYKILAILAWIPAKILGFLWYKD